MPVFTVNIVKAGRWQLFDAFDDYARAEACAKAIVLSPELSGAREAQILKIADDGGAIVASVTLDDKQQPVVTPLLSVKENA